MAKIRRIKATCDKTPRIIEELSGMTSEQIWTLMEERKKSYIIDVNKEIAKSLQILEEQSLVLSRQTEPSPAQMLVHFDI